MNVTPAPCHVMGISINISIMIYISNGINVNIDSNIDLIEKRDVIVLTLRY